MESSLGRLTECGGERGYKHNLFPSCTMPIVSMLTYLLLAKSFVSPKMSVEDREDPYKHNLFYSLLPGIDCVCDIGGCVFCMDCAMIKRLIEKKLE